MDVDNVRALLILLYLLFLLSNGTPFGFIICEEWCIFLFVKKKFNSVLNVITQHLG